MVFFASFKSFLVCFNRVFRFFIELYIVFIAFQWILIDSQVVLMASTLFLALELTWEWVIVGCTGFLDVFLKKKLGLGTRFDSISSPHCAQQTYGVLLGIF